MCNAQLTELLPILYFGPQIKEVFQRKCSVGCICFISVLLFLLILNPILQLCCTIFFITQNSKSESTLYSSDNWQSDIDTFHTFANVLFRGLHIVEYIILICSFWSNTCTKKTQCGDQARGDQAHEDQACGDQARGDQAREDQAREDQARGDQVHGDQAREDQARGDQARGDQAREDQAREDQAREDQAHGDQVRGDQARGDQAHGDQPCKRICTCCEFVGLFLFFCFYVIVVLVAAVFYVIWREYPIPRTQVVYYLHVYVFPAAVFIAILSNGIIRIVMIVTTLQVRAVWKRGCEELDCGVCNPPGDPQDHVTNNATSQVNRICNHVRNTTAPQIHVAEHQFRKLVEKYVTAGESVSSQQIVFEQWFVLQWIIYFLEVVVDCYFVYDLIVSKVYDEKLCVHIILLVYHFLMFAVPHVCGLKMNYHHGQYREKLLARQKMILSMHPNENVRIMYTATLIPENPKYHFIPSIFGISIPLMSTQMLTILLALLAFMLSLISKSVT